MPLSSPAADLTITIVMNTSEPLRAHRFDDLCGRLKWRGNALSEQERLRDEWR